METIELQIERKAHALGYEACGIVSIGALADYDEMLAERIARVPASAAFYENQKRLTNLSAQYPWAKSVVVAARTIRGYNVPAALEGHIAKYYQFDGRVVTESEDYKNSFLMDEYLQSLGLKTATNRHFGLVGLRWAAMKAGLGIVRRNNFFYTKSGSWVFLESWLTDGDMTLVHEEDLPPCPPGCTRCQDACPTKSLSAPYTMQPTTCVSFMLTFGMNDLARHPLAKQTGEWIYGCDACQDACPMNHGKWTGGKEFPGLSELADLLTPAQILKLDETAYREKIQPRFFYLKPDELWKWKVNALNFMRINFQPSYIAAIVEAGEDENDKVRILAKLVLDERAPLSLME